MQRQKNSGDRQKSRGQKNGAMDDVLLRDDEDCLNQDDRGKNIK